MLKFQRAWCVRNVYLAMQTNQCTTNQSDQVENVIIIAHININSSHLTMSVSSHGPSFFFCPMFLFVFMTLAVQGKSFLQCREMDFIVDVRGVRIHHRTMDRHLSLHLHPRWSEPIVPFVLFQCLERSRFCTLSLLLHTGQQSCC
jgi:hypothetical protein